MGDFAQREWAHQEAIAAAVLGMREAAARELEDDASDPEIPEDWRKWLLASAGNIRLLADPGPAAKEFLERLERARADAKEIGACYDTASAENADLRVRLDEARDEWKSCCEREAGTFEEVKEFRAKLAAAEKERDEWKARFSQWEPKDQIISDLSVSLTAAQARAEAAEKELDELRALLKLKDAPAIRNGMTPKEILEVAVGVHTRCHIGLFDDCAKELCANSRAALQTESAPKDGES